jgi:hypothetical protein
MSAGEMPQAMFRGQPIEDERLAAFLTQLRRDNDIFFRALCAIVARHPGCPRGEHPAVDIARDALQAGHSQPPRTP